MQRLLAEDVVTLPLFVATRTVIFDKTVIPDWYYTVGGGPAYPGMLNKLNLREPTSAQVSDLGQDRPKRVRIEGVGEARWAVGRSAVARSPCRPGAGRREEPGSGHFRGSGRAPEAGLSEGRRHGQR